MAQDNTVSFKAYLLQGDTNGKSEVRRFGIDRDVVSSFDYLKEKLQHVFPTVRNQNFIIMWKDAENDDVVISSDDELMIALSEMQNEVRKLYIKVLRTSADPPNIEADLANEAANLLHKGVICNGCNRQIEGYRYHCTLCYDYDLCDSCEAKKIHIGHMMIRIPTSIPNYTLSPYLEPPMPWLSHYFGHGRDRRHHHDRYGKGKFCPAYSTFDDTVYMADEGKKKSSPEEVKEVNKKLRAMMEKFARAGRPDYLKSVGQTIAQFLDPLGIDVDVAVVTKDENENKNEKEKMETEKNGVQNKDPNCHAAEFSNKAGPPQEACVTNTAKAGPSQEACVTDTVKAGPSQEADITNTAAPSECANPETEDWTVLNAAPSEKQQQENRKCNLPEPTVPTNFRTSYLPEPTMTNFRTSYLPEPIVTATFENKVQNGSTGQVKAATSVNQEQAGAGVPSFTKVWSGMLSAGGTSGMQSSGASAPTYTGIEMSTGASDLADGGLPTIAIPPSGTKVPIYTTFVPSASKYPFSNAYLPPLYLEKAIGHVQPFQGYSTYPRPHVAEAVKKMMAMGFSNEGGWLTQLLDIKNGDIEKALDVLQPVKRS